MKKSVLVILLVFTLGAGYAQQDPIYTQYVFNKMLVNPAYTGSTDALTVDIMDRFQWVGIKDGPNTLVFSVNSALPNPHLGVGLFAYRDALGPSVETGVQGTFAYKILFPKGKLSFGVNFGFNYQDIDWTKLNPEDPNDPLVTDQVKNRAAVDAGAGIYYYSNRFYVGISSTHLLQNKISVSDAPNTEGTSWDRLMRHFYGMTGVAIPVSDNFLLRPTLLVKYTQNSPVQADIALSGLIYNVLWIGVGYRTEKVLTLMTEVNIKKSLHIGFSYDAWFNALQTYNRGSYEIRLGYDFDIFKSSKMVSPRYF